MGGKTTQSTTVPQWVEDYSRDTVLPFAQNVANTDFASYGGNLTTGPSAYTGQAADAYGTMANISNMTPQDYAAQTQANMNPYTQNVIDSTLAQSAANYGETQAGLLSNVAGSGAFGNDRRGVAEGQLAADYALGNQSAIANLLNQGYSQAQAQTMAQIANQAGAAGSAASGFGALGAQDMAMQSANNQALYGEFLREQQDPYQRLSALTGAGASIPNQSTTTQKKSPGLFDIVGAGASLFGGF